MITSLFLLCTSSVVNSSMDPFMCMITIMVPFLGLTVRDPRIFLPRKRNKVVNDVEGMCMSFTCKSDKPLTYEYIKEDKVYSY